MPTAGSWVVLKEVQSVATMEILRVEWWAEAWADMMVDWMAAMRVE